MYLFKLALTWVLVFAAQQHMTKTIVLYNNSALLSFIQRRLLSENARSWALEWLMQGVVKKI